MANPISRLGFSPVRDPHGTDIPIGTYKATGSAAIYPGQIVYLSDAGTVTVWTGTATGSLALLGAAISYVSAAATDRDVKIADSPSQLYECQFDDDTTIITALTDFLGANFNGISLTTVNATKLVSEAQIDSSSVTSINNTTALRPFQAVGYREGGENQLGATYLRANFRIHLENHIFGNATGTGVL